MELKMIICSAKIVGEASTRFLPQNRKNNTHRVGVKSNNNNEGGRKDFFFFIKMPGEAFIRTKPIDIPNICTLGLGRSYSRYQYRMWRSVQHFKRPSR